MEEPRTRVDVTLDTQGHTAHKLPVLTITALTVLLVKRGTLGIRVNALLATLVHTVRYVTFVINKTVVDREYVVTKNMDTSAHATKNFTAQTVNDPLTVP
jgi:ABC-type antimicrobial peptide transport system permease subunit